MPSAISHICIVTSRQFSHANCGELSIFNRRKNDSEPFKWTTNELNKELAIRFAHTILHVVFNLKLKHVLRNIWCTLFYNTMRSDECGMQYGSCLRYIQFIGSYFIVHTHCSGGRFLSIHLKKIALNCMEHLLELQCAVQFPFDTHSNCSKNLHIKKEQRQTLSNIRWWWIHDWLYKIWFDDCQFQ